LEIGFIKACKHLIIAGSILLSVFQMGQQAPIFNMMSPLSADFIKQEKNLFEKQYSKDKILVQYFSNYDLASEKEIKDGCLKWYIVNVYWLANRTIYELTCDCWRTGRTYDMVNEHNPPEEYPYSILVFPNSKGQLERLNDIPKPIRYYLSTTRSIRKGDKALKAFNIFLKHADIKPELAFREELGAIFICGVAHDYPGRIPKKIEKVESSDGVGHVVLVAYYEERKEKFDFYFDSSNKIIEVKIAIQQS
jgi:hypothetical protein